jgi:TRAP-type C4-dicarboxylate transport system permease small subunit
MIKKLSDGVYRLTGILVTLDLGLIVILVFSQVVSRYFLKFSIAWAQELTVFLMVWMVFLGCSMGLRQGEIASLSFFVDRLPRRVAFWLVFAADCGLLIFLLVCIVFNNEIIYFAMRQMSPVLGIPMGWSVVSLSVSSVLMVFYTLIHMYDCYGIEYQRKTP